MVELQILQYFLEEKLGAFLFMSICCFSLWFWMLLDIATEYESSYSINSTKLSIELPSQQIPPNKSLFNSKSSSISWITGIIQK